MQQTFNLVRVHRSEMLDLENVQKCKNRTIIGKFQVTFHSKQYPFKLWPIKVHHAGFKGIQVFFNRFTHTDLCTRLTENSLQGSIC